MKAYIALAAMVLGGFIWWVMVIIFLLCVVYSIAGIFVSMVEKCF